jgi:hypothetical protein
MDGSYCSALADMMGKALMSVVILLCLSIPLAIWKVIDIIIWVVNHVDISFIG